MSTASRNKYMVCIGPTPVSRVALQFACAKAKKNNSAVELIHVIEPADFQSLFAVTDKLREERRQEAERLLQEFCALAQTAGITPSINLREGPQGDEIIRATLEDPNVSLLVVGVEGAETRQHNLISWLVARLGSKLLTPLILVPGGLTDQQIEELI